MSLFAPATGQTAFSTQPPPLNLSQPGWPVKTTTLDWEADTRLRRLEAGFDQPGGYIVSPEMFGAAGDGVTDDTQAIQAAINDVALMGPGEVYLANTYLVSSPLQLSQGVSLVGGIQWPAFFTPQPCSNLVCAQTMTTPFVQVPAGTVDFRIQGIAFHSTSGNASAEPIQVNGTSANPCGQFLLRNLLFSHVGGCSFNWANRWRAENCMNQGCTDFAGWAVYNCTIMRWDWISIALAGTGTGTTGNFAAGFHINNSGSILATGISTTGTPYYGVWGLDAASCNFYNTEINGVVADVIHWDGVQKQIGDSSWYRLYNNGNCVNGINIQAAGQADGFVFVGGNVQITDPAGACVVLNQSNAGQFLTGIRLTNVQFAIVSSPGPYLKMTGNVALVNMSNNKLDCFNSTSLTPTIISDHSTSRNGMWNTFVSNNISCNNGAGMKGILDIPASNVGAAGSVGAYPGCGWSISQNPGLNPINPPSPAPVCPPTGVAFSNRYGYDCMVTVGGGTISAIAIGATTLTGVTSGTFRVPSRQTITVTYTVAPTTYLWVPD